LTSAWGQMCYLDLYKSVEPRQCFTETLVCVPVAFNRAHHGTDLVFINACLCHPRFQLANESIPPEFVLDVLGALPQLLHALLVSVRKFWV